MKVKRAMWFANSICIVQISNNTDAVEYYIGQAPGPTETDSVEYIKETWGSRFPNRSGDPLFNIQSKETNILATLANVKHNTSDIPISKADAKLMVALGQSFLKAYDNI